MKRDEKNSGNLIQDATMGVFNTPQLYELRFSPVYAYEAELGIDSKWKASAISKIVNYLEARNIYVTFTDRILDTNKYWENEKGQNWRFLPIAELQGNNICINARNIDFLSILLSIGHIYGHLVQRMFAEKYAAITDFINLPKPLVLEEVLLEYEKRHHGDFKKDFKAFEIEAFRYAKYAFLHAGIEFDEMMDHATNVYIETDFNELWRWVVSEPHKSGSDFMDEFIRIFHSSKGNFPALTPLSIEVTVQTTRDSSLVVIRDGY